MLTGLADDLADGPDAVDRDQLDLAVELLRDVSDYAEDDTVDRALAADRPLGRFVDYTLDGAGSATCRAVRRCRHRIREAGTVPGITPAPRDVVGPGGPRRAAMNPGSGSGL